MINLPLIPIIIFIIILFPIAIISFFKSLRWALMFLGLVLVAGGISFLITWITYKPLLYGWFEKIMVWKFGNDMAIDQMEQISKGTIICVFAAFVILPLTLIIFLIFKLIKRWLNKPLGPKTTKISANEKSIVRKNLKFQKIGSGVISISAALILASTIASSVSIALTPSYKNKFFNKVIKPFSFPLNYGNGYDKDWQRLYTFLDSAKGNRQGINGLRELIQFQSFKGDVASQIARLNDALNKIDTYKLNSYFEKIADSTNLTDIAIRVLLAKFNSGISNQIMANEKVEIKDEIEFDIFLSSFSDWVNSIDKKNLHLTNFNGVEIAIKKLLDENHNYKDTYYFKNKVSIENLIKINEDLLKQSETEYEKLIQEKNGEMRKYDSDFRSMQEISKNLQDKIDNFIAKWQEIGGDNKPYASNYPSIPQTITDFVKGDWVTKDLHDGLPVLYSEENGSAGPGTQVAPLGRKLLNNKLTASGSLSSSNNTVIKQYINAYKDVFGDSGTENKPTTHSPKGKFKKAEEEYETAKNNSNQQLNQLNNYKLQKTQKEREISSTENQIRDAKDQKESLIRERDNLVRSINNQIKALNSKETDKDSAKGDQETAESNFSFAQSITKTAQAARDAARDALDRTDKKAKDYEDKRRQFNDANDNLTSKQKLEVNAQNNLNKANQKYNLLENQYVSMTNKLNNDISRLNDLQGSNFSITISSVNIVSPLVSGLINIKTQNISNLERNLNQSTGELPSIKDNISTTQTKYNNLKKTENQKEDTYNQAKSIYEGFLNTFYNKRKSYEDAIREREKILSSINDDINKIKNYVDSVPFLWNYFVQNSIKRWEIKGKASSFTPPINNIPTINPPDKTNPNWVGWGPPTYQEIPYTDKVKGGVSLVYLNRKLNYLQQILSIANNINISMEKKYQERLKLLANNITRILT